MRHIVFLKRKNIKRRKQTTTKYIFAENFIMKKILGIGNALVDVLVEITR